MNLPLFIDEYGRKLKMNMEIKTKENAKKYFDKLCNIVGNEYKLNYYEMKTDDHLKELYYYAESKNEMIVRLLCLQPDKYKKSENLELGIITLDISNVENALELFDNILKFINENEKSVS